MDVFGTELAVLAETLSDHILVEEKTTEAIHPLCQQPPWFSPPGCRCHPQYRRQPTCMSLMSSEVDNIEKNFNVNHYHHSVSQHKLKEIPTEETHPMEPKFHAYWSKITTKTILLNQTYQIKPSKQFVI